MERSIILNDLKNPSDLFRLRDYLRELFELLDRRHIVVTFSATPTFDCDLGDSFLITMTANITSVTLKNAYKGKKITIIFLQDAVGNFTVAGWAATVKITGASFIATVTASVGSAITLVYDGTNWYEAGRALDLR